MVWATLALIFGLAQAQDVGEPMARFGTTVVKSAGFRGEVYLLKQGTQKLPNFKKMHSKGTIYASSLNVPPMNFDVGFPGITGRYEWFAIDYTGRFWIDQPGHYGFSLLSDDGSKLYIDGRVVIDNDGIHGPNLAYGHVDLTSGLHEIRVSYFQGPRFHVALVLSVAKPGQDFHVFNADGFLPPGDGEK